MKYLKFVVSVFLALIIIALIVQNHEAFNTKVVFKFEVDLLGKSYETVGISIYWICILAFLLGIILTLAAFIIDRFELKKRMRYLQREVNEKDKELNSLRNLPITTDNMLPITQDDNSDMEIT